MARRTQHPTTDISLRVVPQHPVDEAGLAVEVVTGLAEGLDALLEDL